MLSPSLPLQSHRLIWRRCATTIVSALLLWFFSSLAFSQETVSGKKFNYPGGVVELYIPKTSTQVPLARYGTREIALLDQSEQWCMLIGLDLDTLPGEYIVSIADTDIPAYTVKFDVKHTIYAEQPGTAANSTRNIQHSIFSELDYQNTNQPALPLKLPVAGLWIYDFGRVSEELNDIVDNDQPFNSQKQSLTAQNFIYLDSTQIETVLAPQNGIVSRIIQSADGTETASIFIDHGRGLFSIIGGVQDLTVEVGSGVVAGAVIGKLAAVQVDTQPTTLIWQTVLNGVYVNPQILTQL